MKQPSARERLVSMIACTRGIELLEELERAAEYRAMMRCVILIARVQIDSENDLTEASEAIRSSARKLKAKGKR